MPTSHTGAWARPTRIRNKPCVTFVFARYSSASLCLRSPARPSTIGMPFACAYARTRRLKRPAMRIRCVLSSVSSLRLRLATTNETRRDHVPCGNTHSIQSGQRSHSCRSAGPHNERSTNRACLAAKHMPRGARKFRLLTSLTPDFCCLKGHFFAAQSAKKRSYLPL